LMNNENLRLHVTRSTDYGDRYKLFTFEIPKNTEKSLEDFIGIEVVKKSNGNYEITNTDFMGKAEKRGLKFYDKITKIDINSIERPVKEYIYVIGMFLLLIVFYTQKKYK